jgi:tetratricopeptide (TPR) repeat protein
MSRTRISALAWLTLAAVRSFAAPQADDFESIIEHAVQMQQAGDYTGAASAYQTALKLKPGDVATHVNLGVVLVKLGRFNEGIAEYEAADKLLPGDKRIALNLALAYEKSGRLREAVTQLESLHASSPQETQVTMLLADGHLQLGDNQRVIELLQPLAGKDAEDLGIAYMLGTALLREQRIHEGQVLLDRILRNGDSAEARFLLGTRMFESGDYPAAVKQFASAIDLNAHLPQLQSFYGQALLNTGDPEAASVAFRQELTANPSDFDSNLGLAQILVARKQFSEAHPLAQHALLLHPDSAIAKLTLAECLSGSNQFENARPYAEAAARELVNSPESHETLSAIYQGLGLSAKAGNERQIAQSIESASDPGPKLNSLAPDFDLNGSLSNKKTGLSDFRSKSPVVLVFGSYSCPNFRESAGALISMYRRYRASVPFLLIYIREAHASGNWQSTRNERENVSLPAAGTLADKQEHAAMCSRKLHLPFPALVDGMDGRVEKSYNAWPSRAFVISRDGRVLYSTRLTQLNFHATEMESVLKGAIGGRT